MAKLILFMFLLSCSGPNLYKISGETMGTTYSISFYSDVDISLKLKKDIDRFLYEYNYRFSTYIEKSELSLVNQAPVNNELQISDELMSLIKKAYSIYEKSDGMYDVTVGPLVNRWGFGPVKIKGIPSAEEIKKLKNIAGMNLIEFKRDSIIKRKDIYIDLSSIAKGDAVDKVSALIKNKFNIKSSFVEIGGEVKVLGNKTDGSRWKIGIETPNKIQGSGVRKIVELKDQSIATSGSYRNYKKYGDKVFSHLIDPKTAYPVKHKTISVSVIHDSCAQADAWATAFMSIGVEKGLNLAKKEGLKVFFLVKENKEIKEYTSEKW